MNNIYDIIIIGSGIGGLVTGTILSREGYSVCILEKNYQSGGAIQNFSRNGVTFDVGAHYIGGVDEGQNLYKLLRFLNVKDKIKIKKLDTDAYDIISFLNARKEYKHAQGFENFKEKLLSAFPSEEKSLDNYLKAVNEIVDKFPLFKISKGEYTLFNTHAQNQTIGNFLDGLTENQRLKNVLTGNNLLYAGDRSRTPSSVHALIHYSYLESAYRFVGGTSQLADALTNEIKTNGGKVMINSEVVKFHFKDELIHSIELNCGERIFGKHFISNFHPTKTFQLIEKGKVRNVYYKRMLNLKNTVSVFSLYGVLKPETFPYINSNHYIYKNDNVWGVNYKSENWPDMCMFFTQSAKMEEEYAKGYTVLAYMKYDEVAKWSDTTIEKRGDDYLQFKEEKTQKLLDLIERKFPDIRFCTHSIYTATPLTYRDYTATPEGSMCGVVRDAYNLMENLVLPNTKIPNLFFVGQNTILHGVIGVIIGSLLTCSKFINIDKIIDRINQ